MNSRTRENIEFQKHAGILASLGLVRSIATPEGVSYEITESGSRFLEQYQDIERDTSLRLKTGGEVKQATLESDFVIVMPTLNEEKGVARTIDEVRTALEDWNFDILVVDGRSHDGTDTIASQKGVKVVYQRNIGYGDALRTGFLYARRNMKTKAIVMMDADSTYDPNDIPGLVEPLLTEDADMVIGNRFLRNEKGAMSLTNRAGNRILSWFARFTLRLNIHDTQCGLRAFRTELVDCMDLSAEGMPFATEMIADVRSARGRIIELPVAYRPRNGKSKLSPLKDGLLILGTIIRLVRDTQPLLFFGASASIFGVIGIVLGIDVAMEWMQTKTITRLPTVMLAVLLLIGATQLFTFGLVADMIKRLRIRRNQLST